MLEVKFYVPDAPAAPRIKLLEALTKYAGSVVTNQGMRYACGVPAERVHVVTVFIGSNHRNVVHRMAHMYREDSQQKAVRFTINQIETYSIEDF